MITEFNTYSSALDVIDANIWRLSIGATSSARAPMSLDTVNMTLTTVSRLMSVRQSLLNLGREVSIYPYDVM